LKKKKAVYVKKNLISRNNITPTACPADRRGNGSRWKCIRNIRQKWKLGHMIKVGKGDKKLENYFRYWGKAEKEGLRYHLLPYHCLDVAAMGQHSGIPTGL
jgi:hypothetical protein